MNTEQERAAFEWWASDEGESPRAVDRVGECYKLAQIQSYWMAWQARAALQSQDREDAERYRWLRNEAGDYGLCAVHIDYWSDEYIGQAYCEVYDGDDLDKAIDHARRTSTGTGGSMSTEQERAAFEAWLRVKPCGAAHDLAWEAWKAARAALQSRDRDALREIANWPNGGKRYGQEKIKDFARRRIEGGGE